MKRPVPDASAARSQPSEPPDPESIRKALERVLASQVFANAQKHRAFLQCVVELWLAGRTEEIKEYSIAVQVYGHKPDYDPQANSAVRVDASRLRTRLKTYYETEGLADEIRIDLPKGSYVPQFTVRPRVADETPRPEPAETPQSDAAEPPQPVGRTGSRFRWAAAGIVALAALAAAVAVLQLRSSSPGASAGPPSIGVLPFVSLSPEAADDRFCEGVTEEITAQLARIPKLQVASRTAMAQYKGQPLDLRELGERLGLSAFLEGSLRREGDRYLLTAQLIDARTGYHLWAESYDRRGVSALDLQRELAAEISASISERAFGHTPWRDTGQPPEESSELADYLRAHDLLQNDPRRDGWPAGIPPPFEEAIRLLEGVTSRSPRFANGWAALGHARLIVSEFAGDRETEMVRAAKEAAQRALSLDSTIAEAHYTVGDIALYRDWDLRTAENSLRRATELNPRGAAIQAEYADVLRILGRLEQADTELRRAIMLSPQDGAMRAQRAVHLYDFGRFEECRQEADRASARRPDFTMAFWIKGLCYQAEGRHREAEAEFRRALAIAPADGRALPALGHLYGATGRRGEAERVLATLAAMERKGRRTAYGQALVHVGLGDPSRALDALERALNVREPSVPYMGVERRFEPLRDEERFRQIGVRAGVLR